MKRMIVSVIVTVALCVGLTVPAFAAGGDTPSPWAVPQVDAAIAANLVPAGLQSSYTRPITRAEFAALAVALYETAADVEIPDRATFTDTTDVNVEKAAALGIVVGVDVDLFDPDAGLTREQAAVILLRLTEAVQDLEGSVVNVPEIMPATFADNDSISDWAIESIGIMQSFGIMGGVGGDTFAPQEPYTREQSIVTIMRVYEFAGVAPEKLSTRSFDIESINATFVPALGEDYIGVLPPLGIDSDEFLLENGRGIVETPVVILDREYMPIIYTNGSELSSLWFRAEANSIEEVMPDILKLMDELNTLYGAPYPAPYITNTITNYLENEERAAAYQYDEKQYNETWMVRDNFNGIEGMRIEARLSLAEHLHNAFDENAQPFCTIEIEYRIAYTGYRDSAGAYRQVR